MINTLIFDLDNTLIDRQRAFTEMLFLKFSELESDKETVKQMVDDVLIWDNFGAVERKVSLGNWADKYGYSQELALSIGEEWSKNSGTVAYLYPDVRETLTTLKEKYTIAILTNGNASSQRRKMQTIDIYDLLDYSLVSGECEFKKPQKEIFDLVLNDLNISANEAIYIGDTYKIDVLGSRNAGLKPIYVDRKNESHNDVFTIHEIKELLIVDFENI